MMANPQETLAIDITRCIRQSAAGDEDARNQLFLWTQERLRGTASAIRRNRWNAGGLQTRTLLQETFLKMEENGLSQVGDRAEFSKLATKVMRDLLFDFSRKANAQKRNPEGGFANMGDLGNEQAPGVGLSEQQKLLQLKQALDRLEAHDLDLFEVLMLHGYFGYSLKDTAEFADCSVRTAHRRFQTARAMMYRWLDQEVSQ